jgi:hypothetical protein
MNPPENRRSKRMRMQEAVEFFELNGTLLLGVGRLINLSTVGALVESSLRLEPGQRVTARLRRKGRSILELPAQVVRVRGKGALLTYGLEFIPPRRAPR